MAEAARPNRPTHHGTVSARTELSPNMVRLRITSDAVRSGDFAPNGFTDTYLKIVLPDADGHDVQRTYTVRNWVTEDNAFDVDFVVHGDEGLAGPWARHAQIGDPVTFRGPGGGYAPSPEASAHLFVGDLAALPAIEVALSAIAADVTGRVILVTDHAEDQRDLETQLPVEWFCDTDLAAAYDRAAAAVEAMEATPGLQVFVHGEAGFVRRLRRHLRVNLNVPAALQSISGYWKLGRTDEGWRADKKDWQQPVDAREAEVIGQ